MTTNTYQKVTLALEAAFFIEGRTNKQRESLIVKVAKLPEGALKKIMKLCVTAESEASHIQKDFLHTMKDLLRRAKELRLAAKNDAAVSEKNQDSDQAMNILKKLSDA